MLAPEAFLLYDVRVDIEQVTDEHGLRELHDVVSEVLAHDHVGLPADPFEEMLPNLHPGPDDPDATTFWTGRVSGRVVAAGSIGLPRRENLEVADVGVSVRPGSRSAGVGRELLAHLLEVVHGEGRTIVHGQVASPWEASGPTPAETLLASLGARPLLFEARRLLDLHRAVPLEVPTAAGYRLEQWVDVAPGPLVAGLAHLSQRMSTDAPQGDLALEPEAWDEGRYRAAEAAALARNRVRVVTAAVHEATGVVAGMTDYGVNRDRQAVAYQWDTIVDRDHRGHGLGLAMKVHNLAALRRAAPAVRWVNTWNAISNSHMVAVNDRLGFVPVERWTEWELQLPDHVTG